MSAPDQKVFCHSDDLLASALPGDLEPVFMQSVRRHGFSDATGEVRQLRHAAGFFMQLLHREAPAAFLATGMLSGNTAEPTLDSAFQLEVILMDSQYSAGRVL